MPPGQFDTFTTFASRVNASKGSHVSQIRAGISCAWTAQEVWYESEWFRRMRANVLMRRNRIDRDVAHAGMSFPHLSVLARLNLYRRRPSSQEKKVRTLSNS